MIRACLLAAILMPGWPASQSAEEPVPGIILPEELELPNGRIAVGTSHDEAAAALGAGWRFVDKPKHYTGSKLASQADLIQQLTPMYPKMVALARKAAVDCGQSCWIELLELKIGKRDAVRLSLLGATKETMAVYMIALDQGGMAMRSWRMEFMQDLRQDSTYFVTDSGTFRVRRLGRIYKIERAQ